jgi:hypothetical protein
MSGGSVLRTDATRTRYTLSPRAKNWDTATIRAAAEKRREAQRESNL